MTCRCSTKDISTSSCVNSGCRSQVLVAEAAADLEVFVHARHHQDLLEDLRRLRQRVELALVHARRHEVVARALGRGLGEDGRLHLDEAEVREPVAQREQHAVPHGQRRLRAFPAQVEVAVLQPELLGDAARRVRRRELEGRRLRRREHLQRACEHLHLAGPALAVGLPRRPRPHDALHADHRLGLERARLGAQRRRHRVVEGHLRDAVFVSQIHEDEGAAELAAGVHPARERDALADVRAAQLAAVV
jgi:hypothetical protein